MSQNQIKTSSKRS